MPSEVFILLFRGYSGTQKLEHQFSPRRDFALNSPELGDTRLRIFTWAHHRWAVSAFAAAPIRLVLVANFLNLLNAEMVKQVSLQVAGREFAIVIVDCDYKFSHVQHFSSAQVPSRCEIARVASNAHTVKAPTAIFASMVSTRTTRKQPMTLARDANVTA